MYDTSGANNLTFNATIQNDWAWIISQGYTNSTAYQYHNNKPVVALWGFGFEGRNIGTDYALSTIQALQETATVMGGVPFYWRTGDQDSDPGWLGVYTAFDIISPWSVGRYSDSNSFTTLMNQTQIPDVAYIQQQGLNISYAPVIWPGFSWANLVNDPTTFNIIPRQGGSFYCAQANGIVNSVHPTFIYVAMFDEVNEGTAIFKAVATSANLPNGAKFLYLNIDGGNYPTDRYLTLSGSITLTMRSRMCEEKPCSMSTTCNAKLDEESFMRTVINRTVKAY